MGIRRTYQSGVTAIVDLKKEALRLYGYSAQEQLYNMFMSPVINNLYIKHQK